jgi:hypothetical protein
MVPTKKGGLISMNTYDIEVNLVDAAGLPTRKALEVNPKRMQVKVPGSGDEVAQVTWTFSQLPAGLTPVITFDSQEVIASGPTTTLGATPQVTCEIRFPTGIVKDLLEYPAGYSVSLSSGSTKKSGILPLPIAVPSLVVVRSPDPNPGGGGG